MELQQSVAASQQSCSKLLPAPCTPAYPCCNSANAYPSESRMSLIALLTLTPLGDFVTYPVQSTNIANAPNITAWVPIYAFTGGERGAAETYNLGYDTHFMVGLETLAGELVAAGQGFEGVAGPSTGRDMVVIRASASGSVLWTWKSGFVGDDAVTTCVQLSADSIIVGGFRTVSGTVRRTLVKIRLDTNLPAGTSRVVWTASMDDSRGHSAYSTLASAPDGGLLLGGFVNKRDTTEMQFHSSGVVPDGQAFVSKIQISSLNGATAPTAAAETAAGGGWMWIEAAWITAVTVKPSASGGVAVALHTETNGKKLTGWAKLSSAGVLLGTIKTYPNQLQGTAMAAGPNGGYLIAGVGDVAAAGQTPAYKGRVTRIDEQGNLLWNISLTASGIDSRIIYTECWGVEPSAGGWVLSCGSGIENNDACNGLPDATDRTNCLNGQGDLRPGAGVRAPGVWSFLSIFVTDGGQIGWSRVDSYLPDADPEDPGFVPVSGSSAADWVVANLPHACL